MHVGVDYYPEHWPRDRWKTDAALMGQARFTVVRLAEFAWVEMESVEGQFDFQWLDEAIDELGKQNIKVILGTPTAVMPAWVARKYPDTLAVKKDGSRTTWGVRKENCFSNGTYRLLSERITRAMAERYGDHPGVIGWQTDNELSGPVCYCDSCRADFQDWLRQKYGDLDSLNRAWGTHFWGHRVQTWDEIQHPVEDHSSNPSALLDRRRHQTWLEVRFQRDQINILRRQGPGQFVTHNFMGVAKVVINYFELARDLDFVSWDNYPVWFKPDVPYDAAMGADLMRGLKGKNFWIMEQTAGPCGWGGFWRNPWPGEIRSISYQQLAHGADCQLWFRWRTCTAGREQYWHGLLGHDGKPLRRYNEAKQVAGEFSTLSQTLQNTTVQADVAMVYDYDSLWALQFQPGYPEADYAKALGRYYQALFRAGVNVDLVSTAADFSRYKLVLIPHLHLLPDAVADRLNQFVQAGGVLMADMRTAVKDENNLCHDRTLPGKLSDILGINIEEYESLAKEIEYPVKGSNRLAGPLTAVWYADWVSLTSAEAVAKFEPWQVAAFAAITRNQAGKGVGWYVGTIFKDPAAYDRIIEQMLKDANIQPTLATVPPGVEVSVRQGGGRKIVFIINHTPEPITVSLPAGKHELLMDTRTTDSLNLSRFGVAVLLW